jgi:hypothetical protein
MSGTLGRAHRLRPPRRHSPTKEKPTGADKREATCPPTPWRTLASRVLTIAGILLIRDRTGAACLRPDPSTSAWLTPRSAGSSPTAARNRVPPILKGTAWSIDRPGAGRPERRPSRGLAHPHSPRPAIRFACPLLGYTAPRRTVMHIAAVILVVCALGYLAWAWHYRRAPAAQVGRSGRVGDRLDRPYIEIARRRSAGPAPQTPAGSGRPSFGVRPVALPQAWP